HDWANRTPVACFARTGPERRTQSAERKSKKAARNASMGGCASHFYILRSAFCVPGRCTKSTFKRDRFNHPRTRSSLPLQHPMPQNPRDLPHRRIGLFSVVVFHSEQNLDGEVVVEDARGVQDRGHGRESGREFS